jgi:hypothetical protein
MHLQCLNEGCHGTNRGFADVAHSIALDPAPLDGTSPVPKCQVASALAVQRDGLSALHSVDDSVQYPVVLQAAYGMFTHCAVLELCGKSDAGGGGTMKSSLVSGSRQIRHIGCEPLLVRLRPRAALPSIELLLRKRFMPPAAALALPLPAASVESLAALPPRPSN